MRGVLQRLPEGHRTILALSDCDELSDRDVAAVLGLTVGAAKIRLHRARARLKVELERECTFYRDPENVLCCDRRSRFAPVTVATWGQKSSFLLSRRITVLG